eukprot:TRINITY_DN23500_c0_g3_i1.p1 TRINITY_DN23500_c0_g3~~TRINITY_DN23500_c0_g3_i1.p1  ORF type:complete len:380 (+),score=66.65 TRINITY_DN23500_c0_g3_i1:25-1164(+)
MEPDPVVIDFGSGVVKFGLAAVHDSPLTIPCVLGQPKLVGETILTTKTKQLYIGDEALTKRGLLALRNPLENYHTGIVGNWDDVEAIWEHIFDNELKVSAEEHPVLLSEVPLNLKANRDKMTEIMFENFGVPSLYLANAAVLALYASGRFTGVVLQSGENATHVVPVYEGYAISQNIVRIDLNGRQLTDYMLKLLCSHGYPFISGGDRKLAQDVKEKLSYVALDFESEVDRYSQSAQLEQAYDSPEPAYSIGNERCEAPEALFQPRLIGLEEQKGIHVQIYDSITKCDSDLRNEFFGNILLSGGNTMFPGIEDRLRKELNVLVDGQGVPKIKVIAPPERKYSVYCGGCILASLPASQPLWITRDEFDEFGPSVVNRKCF